MAGRLFSFLEEIIVVDGGWILEVQITQFYALQCEEVVAVRWRRLRMLAHCQSESVGAPWRHNAAERQLREVPPRALGQKPERDAVVPLVAYLQRAGDKTFLARRGRRAPWGGRRAVRVHLVSFSIWTMSPIEGLLSLSACKHLNAISMHFFTWWQYPSTDHVSFNVACSLSLQFPSTYKIYNTKLK